MPKIGLCGSVSVGKTTLVKALADLPQFKDYKVAIERSQYLMSLGIPLNTDSTLKGQTIFLAERCSELFMDNIITDRTVIDVMAFTLSASSINHLDKDKFIDYASEFISEYDYIFYISPEGVEIEDNGIRAIDPLYRKKIDETIQSLINKYSYKSSNIYFIKGTTDERIKQILNIVGV
jgi:nicotinamide riboside kinase